jgi:hypothetical protein
MIKNVYHIADIIFGMIGSLAFFDTIKIQIGMLQNVDNSIKLGSSLLAFIYFGLRIFFYYHKSKGEILLQKEQIRELEIRNNEKDLTNHIFGKSLDFIPIDEYNKSKERLKDK